MLPPGLPEVSAWAGGLGAGGRGADSDGAQRPEYLGWGRPVVPEQGGRNVMAVADVTKGRGSGA